MYGHRQGVQRDEDDVGRQRGAVAVHGHLDGAELERAVGLGAEDDHIGGWPDGTRWEGGRHVR